MHGHGKHIKPHFAQCSHFMARKESTWLDDLVSPGCLLPHIVTSRSMIQYMRNGQTGIGFVKGRIGNFLWGTVLFGYRSGGT